MPLYSYFCRDCGEFKVSQKITESPLKRCINCGCENVEKLMTIPSPPSFKGSGFYETDYKQKHKK